MNHQNKIVEDKKEKLSISPVSFDIDFWSFSYSWLYGVAGNDYFSYYRA